MNDQQKTQQNSNASTASGLSFGKLIETRTVRVEDLKWDGCIFPRARLKQAHVDELTEIAPAFDGGPMVVDDRLRIVDGVHRYNALKQAQVEHITVEVRKYEDDAEILAHAVALNSRHGDQLTQDEKRDWAKAAWRGSNDTSRLAAICAVHSRTVRRWMEEKLAEKTARRNAEIEAKRNQGIKVEDVAAATGVSRSTVTRVRQKGQMSKMTQSHRKKSVERSKKTDVNMPSLCVPTDTISCVKSACPNLGDQYIPSLDASPPTPEQPVPRAAWFIAHLLRIVNDFATERDKRAGGKRLKPTVLKRLEKLNEALEAALKVADVEFATAEEPDVDNVVSIAG